ncbi:MAG: hypothetical protein OJF50_006469 [Nitrospira sp.]|jgi:hypothetical protein|nr:hypothetical protein [Nitrospira sp.]
MNIGSGWLKPIGWLCCAGWVLGAAPQSWAKQEIVVTEDAPILVEISGTQLTLIKMPSPVVQNGLITVSPTLEIRANGKNVVIDPKGVMQPADLAVMTEHQSYVFQLRPKPIPAEIILIQDIRVPAGGGRTDVDTVKRSEGYVDTNVDLLRQASQGALPKSCTPVRLSAKAYPKWLELDVLEATEYRCPVYTVTAYTIYNSKDRILSLRQTEFFTGNELSIALSRQVLKPTEDGVLLIVSYTKATPPDKRKVMSADPEPWRAR